MIDAYQIGVDLVLNDAILGTTEKLYGQFNRVQETVNQINASLRATIDITSGAASMANTMADAFKRAADAADRMRAGAGAWQGGGGYQPPPWSGGGSGSDGGNGPRYLPYGGGPDPLRLSGPGGGDGAFSMPLYPTRSPVPDEVFNPPKTGAIDPMHAMSLVFMGQAAAGIVSEAVKGAVGPAFDVQQQQVNIQNMTPGPLSAGLAAARAALGEAVNIQQSGAVPGMKVGQIMAMIGNLYSVDRNMPDVMKLATSYARDGFILSNAQGGGDANDQLYTLLRSSEDLGKLNLLNKNGTINTDKAMGFIDQYTRLVANSNGNLTGYGALTMIGQAGPGATQMSDVALSRAIIASQALGPSQTGTGLNAMYQEFIGGKMSQATARALHDAGVLPDYMFGKNDKILDKYKYGIGQVMLPPGVLKDEQMALQDPIGWASQNLFSQYLNKDGTVKTGDAKDVEALIASLSQDFSRTPGGKVAGNAIFNWIVQNRAMINAASIPSLPALAAQDASTGKSQSAGAGAAWNAFLQAVGSPLIPGATRGLALLTASLNTFASGARGNPDIDKAAATDLGIASIWALFKTISKLPDAVPGVKAAGVGADFAADMATGPAGLIGLFAQAVAVAMTEGNKKIASAMQDGTAKAFDGRIIRVQVTNPGDLATSLVTGIAKVQSRDATGPTGKNSAVVMPLPGQVNRINQ